jgi:hypothetical protein
LVCRSISLPTGTHFTTILRLGHFLLLPYCTLSERSSHGNYNFIKIIIDTDCLPRQFHAHTHTQIDHAIQSQCPLLSIFPFRGMQLATRRSGTSFIRLGSNQHQHRQLDDDIVVVVTRPCTTLVASRVVLATCASVTSQIWNQCFAQ